VARRQRHRPDLARVPCGDDVPAAVGICFDLRDDLVNLVDAAVIGGAPIRPLRTINAAQIAVGVRPFVPDGHAIRVERFYVRVAAQKPEQFVGDGFEMGFLGGDERKVLTQRKPHLRAENGKGACASAVSLELSVFEDVPQQIEVLNHRGKNLTTKRAREKKFRRAKKPFAIYLLS
jgi:hypothetical protein